MTRIDLIAAILAEHEKTGGATFNLRGENLAGRDAYAVSFLKDREYKTLLGLNAHTLDNYIDDNIGLLSIPLNTAIGTWRDESTGLSYVDVVAIIDDRELAMRAGREAQQIAIFNLKTQEVIAL